MVHLDWLFSPDRDPDPDIDTFLRQHAFHLIFKHSPLCVVSTLARDQVENFSRLDPSVPITVVDVIRQRPLSKRIAARTGVRHASPQVLLVRNGDIRWHVSHQAITVDALSRAVAQLSGDSTQTGS